MNVNVEIPGATLASANETASSRYARLLSRQSSLLWMTAEGAIAIIAGVEAGCKPLIGFRSPCCFFPGGTLYRAGFALCGEGRLVRKAIRVSDISGKRIDAGTGARVRIVYDDARKGAIEIDVLPDEVADLAAKGRKARRRDKLRSEAR